MRFSILGRSFTIGEKGQQEQMRSLSPTSPTDVQLIHMLDLQQVTMTPDVASGIPAAHYCVDKIASFIASMPRGVYQKTEQGRSKATDHDQHRLISARPNPYMSQYEYDKMCIYTLLFWGNSYEYIERNRAGRPIAYWYWHPEDVTIEVMEGELYYKNHNVGITTHYTNIIHTTDGPISKKTFKAKSRISRSLDLFKEAKSFQNFSRAFIENGAHVGMAVVFPGKLDSAMTANVKGQIDTDYSGSKKAGKTLILSGGADVKNIGMPLRDAQLLETREMHAQDIGLIFGFKPGQIGGKAGESFNSLEQYNIEFLQYPCLPIAKQREQAYDERIFREREQGVYYTKIDFKGLLRGSTKDRIELYKAMSSVGALTANDMLELEDMNTFDGGDERIVMMNMTTMQNIIEGNNLSNKPDTNE